MWTAARRSTAAAPLSLSRRRRRPRLLPCRRRFRCPQLPTRLLSGETEQEREVERRPIGSAFGTAIAEHRWSLTGDLHLARRQEPMLARCGGPPSARLRTQADYEVLAKACHYYRLPPKLLGLNRERPGAAPAPR